jgi:hypothetical protein
MRTYLAAFAGLALLAAAPAGAAEIARIKQAVGDASLQRGTARLPAKVGDRLLTGDKLLTGKTGRIALTFHRRHPLRRRPEQQHRYQPLRL